MNIEEERNFNIIVNRAVNKKEKICALNNIISHKEIIKNVLEYKLPNYLSNIIKEYYKNDFEISFIIEGISHQKENIIQQNFIQRIKEHFKFL